MPGVGPETAEVLMISCVAAGHALDMDTVWTMVEQLGAQDPQAEARRLLGNELWSGRRKRGAPATSIEPAKSMRRVSQHLEPDLWRRCCEASGHVMPMTGKDGCWAFDTDLVAQLEATE